MALVTEVENHGEFVWRYSTGTVPSPYGGPDQAEYVEGHGDSFATPGAAVRTSAPDEILPAGEITFTGTFQTGDNISLNWFTYEEDGTTEISARGINGNIPYPCDAEEAARLVGEFINGNVDTGGAQGGGKLVVFPKKNTSGGPDAYFINVGEPVVTPAAP